jgi:hypothetical protein
MADLLVTSTGRIFYRVDDCMAALLIEAFGGAFERVKPPAPPAPVTTPRFYVGPSPTTSNIGLHVQLPTGEIRSAYKSTTKKGAESALSAGEIPEHIWESFVQRSKATNCDERLSDFAASQVAGNRWR